MTGSLDIRVALNRSAVPADQYLEEPLYAVLDIIPEADLAEADRPPLNLALVVDSSATMHNFQLTDEERDFWLTLAVSRDEMERGQADERHAIYWSGQTLADMQAVVRKPMSLAVEAIKSLLQSLRPSDKITVIAFADQVHSVFGAADWATFPDQCLAQLDLLRDQRLPVDIGTGTYMAAALRLAGEALQQNAAEAQGINRLIVISDGIVQDPDATMLAVSAIQDQGYAITTLGVGDEFDEEFLIRVADNSRGEYHYAATSEQITQRLTEEMTSLQTVSVTDMYIAVRGLGGTVIQDIALVRPAMTLFEEVFTENDWMRARIGDVSGAAPVAVLVQLAPTSQPQGRHPMAEAQFTWAVAGGTHRGKTQIMIEAEFSSDPLRLARTDEDVSALVDRFSVYRMEREAQRAQERGDVEKAREKLGAATRQLRKIGEEQLAEDMEGQIAALSGAAQDAARVKRIKATTRRLGSAPTTGRPEPQ
ncbi:MAG: VWA domain-containing protein [Armatimonadetes bacterium]|nr:VWA domain-containing protein [Armatimonadota bacterium]